MEASIRPALLRTLKSWAQIVIMLLVAAGLAWAIYQSSIQLTEQPLAWREFRWWQMMAAIPCSAFAVFLGGVMWRATLNQMKLTTGWRLALTAYAASQLGKYVPGKAMVLIVRVAMLRVRGGPLVNVVSSCFIETLFWLLVGAELACLALVLFFPNDGRLTWMIALCAVGVACAVSPPALSRLANYAASRLSKEPMGAEPLSFTWTFFFMMHLGFAAAWFFQAGALWMVMAAVGGDLMPEYGGALALATMTSASIIGFLTMLPGGLGARELVIIPLLAAPFSLPQALTIAIIIRLVTIGGELLLAITMYALRRRVPVVSETSHRA